MDLMVAVSCGLTLQICLIVALSFRCRHWRQGFVTGQVSLAWSIASAHTCLERKVAGRENWFQLLELLPGGLVFTRVVVESSQPPAAESMSPR